MYNSLLLAVFDFTNNFIGYWVKQIKLQFLYEYGLRFDWNKMNSLKLPKMLILGSEAILVINITVIFILRIWVIITIVSCKGEIPYQNDNNVCLIFDRAFSIMNVTQVFTWVKAQIYHVEKQNYTCSVRAKLEQILL